MADPLNNLRAAYHELADKVYAALHTQVGDAARLRHACGCSSAKSSYFFKMLQW